MHLQSKDACPGRSVTEKEVQTAILRALNSLASEKPDFLQRRESLQVKISSMQTKIIKISRIILEFQDQLARCGTLLEMNKTDSSLEIQAQLLSSHLAGLKRDKQLLNEKRASLAYEERQLANILDFIKSHEINGCFIPETKYREEDIMLLLEQVRVLEKGYVISFKIGKKTELHIKE